MTKQRPMQVRRMESKELGNDANYISVRKTAKSELSAVIFQVCIKPDPGSGIIGAYFHLPPFVNLAASGEKVGQEYLVGLVLPRYFKR